jgi:hypothetical protein
MKETFAIRCYRTPRAEIGYLRFIVESYDGLLFLRTLDAGEGLLEFRWSPTRAADAEDLLRALAVETGLKPVPSPPPGRYPEL